MFSISSTCLLFKKSADLLPSQLVSLWVCALYLPAKSKDKAANWAFGTQSVSWFLKVDFDDERRPYLKIPTYWGTREITRLDIMAYLNPTCNPGSKPQRFRVKNCKSSTSDKLQTFKTVFWHSKFLAKNSI